ncbi:LysR family transcriptional regulator [Salmonella enterica subsp. enterica]|nr:LysR family transcriptional regulator [Salmonella enterica subsp. enterica]
MNLLQMDMNLLKVLYVLLETSFYGENGAKAGFIAFCGKSCVNEIARCAKRPVVSTGREPPDCYALCAGAA